MATLLFLGASVSQAAAIRRAGELGHRTIAVDGDPAATAVELCDVFEQVDFSDVDLVADVGVRHGVEGVLAISSDRAVVPAAQTAYLLGLPGPDTNVAIAMTSKAVMRRSLAAAGVPQPTFAVVRSADDIEAATHVSYPAVLKPSDSGGQRGVFLVESAADAAERLPTTLAFSRSRDAILEQFHEGTELNGLFVVRGGVPSLVTFSDRLRPPGPGFGVGWIHSFPSSLDPTTLAAAERVASAAIRALGLRDGIAFPQLIASVDGDVRVVEVAARIAAGQMADLVRFGVGVDLYDVAFALALGEPVTDEALAQPFRKPIAIRFLTASPGVLPVGEVTRIGGLEDVRAAEGVLAADLYFSVGAHLSPVQVDADRSGYVIATADSPELALELADRASTRLTVEVSHASRRRAIGCQPIADAVLMGFLLCAAAAVLMLGGSTKLRHAAIADSHIDRRLSLEHISVRLLRVGPDAIAKLEKHRASDRRQDADAVQDRRAAAIRSR